jgi:drug/metabolite transporter (DMT)-like permease
MSGGPGKRRPDPTTIAAGIAAIVVGVLLALDQDGTIELGAGWIAVLVCAAAGLVLLAGSLTGRDD